MECSLSSGFASDEEFIQESIQRYSYSRLNSSPENEAKNILFLLII